MYDHNTHISLLQLCAFSSLLSFCCGNVHSCHQIFVQFKLTRTFPCTFLDHATAWLEFECFVHMGEETEEGSLPPGSDAEHVSPHFSALPEPPCTPVHSCVRRILHAKRDTNTGGHLFIPSLSSADIWQTVQNMDCSPSSPSTSSATPSPSSTPSSKKGHKRKNATYTYWKRKPLNPDDRKQRQREYKRRADAAKREAKQQKKQQEMLEVAIALENKEKMQADLTAEQVCDLLLNILTCYRKRTLITFLIC